MKYIRFLAATILAIGASQATHADEFDLFRPSLKPLAGPFPPRLFSKARLRSSRWHALCWLECVCGVCRLIT